MQIAEKVKEFFHNEGIHSTTIQPEFVEIGSEIQDEKGTEKIENCVLDCPPQQRTNCVASTCCGPQKKKPNNILNGDPNDQTGDDNNFPPAYSAVLRRNNRRSADSLSLNGFYSVSVVPSQSPLKETKDDSGV